MTIAKQMEIRANIKKYFDIAYNGDPVIVPRKENKNVVIISEEEYRNMEQLKRASAYSRLFSPPPGSKAANDGNATDIKTFNLNKLFSISNLKEGWNGNGAPAFSHDLISKVRDILENLIIQPQLFPTALQTIQFEYDNSRRDHMEIEVGTSDMAEIFCVTYNGTESFEQIPATYEQINKRVGVFFG